MMLIQMYCIRFNLNVDFACNIKSVILQVMVLFLCNDNCYILNNQILMHM